MKTALEIIAIAFSFVSIHMLMQHALAKQSTTTIRTHHRLTPRLELIIDSGRVDTVYVYKAEGK